MKLVVQSPKKALKAFLKQKPLRSEIDRFKTNLIALLDKISVIEKGCHDESEEHLKNNIRDFLRDTYYKETNAINTKDKKDLVIHLGKTTDTEVGVIIEAKRPSNINEMLSADNPNRKALHELILYYLDERNKAENIQLKHLIVTNINEWYIIDANYFDKHIYRNTQIKKLYDTKINDKKDNPFFYEEVAKIIANFEIEIPCIYFDIRQYNTILRNDKKEDDRELSALFKILSPQHLLKIATPNDSNSLNEKFYKELLHIIGLEEAKEGSKNIIRRKIVNRNPASLIESTIDSIITEDSLHRITDQSIYGETKEEKVFNVSLELCLTWINRILFLKLLEGQLIAYHQGNKDYRFLNSETIHDFDELFKLFHKVLAVNLDGRNDKIKEKFGRIPYLNSSLFEISELEDLTIKINALDNDGQLELISTTILKDIKKNTDKLPTLDYFFKFLDAYDFASEGTEDIQEDNKTIINASVLGKVFEKINGYKDGSIFTPGFITMYMCKQSIRLAVLEKFNEALTENSIKPFDKFEDIKNYTSRLFKTQDVIKANEIINSLRICDIAVGSGHFLVSSLNEIISIKAELGILADEQGNTINGYEVEIVNDELIITDREGNIFEYKLLNGKPINKEIQRLQKALFYEKQTIIENCLFGVDINPNSVKICRLRLWIELLKNAYYKEETGFSELETLPNIDINIKCGNSLISRFALDADLSLALKSIKYDIKAYRGFVKDYKNVKDRELKKGLLKIIDTIKSDFRINIDDPFKSKISRARGEVTNVLSEMNRKQQWGEKLPKELKDKLENVTKKLALLEAEKDAIINNVIYKNAFEWRFEFPEVLNNNGDFEGFDLIIGNPPYIQLQNLKNESIYFENAKFKTYHRMADIYCIFYEMGIRILKSNCKLSYITSNKFIKSNYGLNLRKYLSQFDITEIIDFGELPVFDNASTFPCIISLNKSDISGITYYTQVDHLKFDSLKEYTITNGVVLNPNIIKSDKWVITNDDQSTLIEKLKKNSITLDEYTNGEILFGIKTGYNEAFIINEITREELIKEDPKSSEIIFPFVNGDDVRKFKINWKNSYLILAKTGIDLNKYPAVLKHMEKYREKLENRSDKGINWWDLRRCSYYNVFESPKILYPDIALESRFTIDKSGFVPNATLFCIPREDYFLLGLLNSKLIWYYLSKVCPVLGDINNRGRLRLKTIYIKELPIRFEPSISNKIEDLTIKTLDFVNMGKDITELEKQIDELVYLLYEITLDEQKIIEGK